MHLYLCMQVYICVHDEGREILGSVKLGRGGMMVWKAKLEEMNMRPEKDLLSLSVEEHGLDSGDHRSLLYGINRADGVGSSGWSGWERGLGGWVWLGRGLASKVSWAEGCSKGESQGNRKDRTVPRISSEGLLLSLLTDGEMETQNHYVSCKLVSDHSA